MNKLSIYFAPLQGYTEDAFRRAHHDVAGGIGVDLREKVVIMDFLTRYSE